MVAVLQQAVESQDDFNANYKVSPKLVEGEPMLIENTAVVDRFNQQMAQRKRQRTK